MEIKKNLVNYSFGAAFLIAVVAGIPNMVSNQSDNQKLRDKANALELEAASRLIEREAARSEILEGCLIALNSRNKAKYADIRNGIPVKAANGTQVCSRKGEIGTVENGKLVRVKSAGQPIDVKEFATRTNDGSVLIDEGTK